MAFGQYPKESSTPAHGGSVKHEHIIILGALITGLYPTVDSIALLIEDILYLDEKLFEICMSKQLD